MTEISWKEVYAQSSEISYGCTEDFGICPLKTKEHPMGFTICKKNWYCICKYLNNNKRFNPSNRNHSNDNLWIE